MSLPNDGPAFPQLLGGDLYEGRDGQSFSIETAGGMTLRDYFAAVALGGLIASNDDGAGDRLSEVPEYAYQIADAMLAEREKK